MQFEYQSITPADYDEVVELANQVHGDNYISHQALHDYVTRSTHNGISASVLARHNTELVGFRLTLAAGQWGIDNWCTPTDWGFAEHEVCYFKVITVAPQWQGYGVGKGLLSASINHATKQGAKAGLAHIWMESPNNNAFGYFSASGGELVRKHPRKWLKNCIEDGYVCPICGTQCDCTAAEMILKF